MYTEPLPTCIPLYRLSRPGGNSTAWRNRRLYEARSHKVYSLVMTKDRYVKLVAKIIENETGFDPLQRTYRRIRKLCEARQILMVMLIEHTNRTLADIGSVVDKDHATVINGRETISNLCNTDKRFKAMFDRINEKVKKLR